jgi:hypothetical protein
MTIPLPPATPYRPPLTGSSISSAAAHRGWSAAPIPAGQRADGARHQLAQLRRREYLDVGAQPQQFAAGVIDAFDRCGDRTRLGYWPVVVPGP